jgi:hypothetical protein
MSTKAPGERLDFSRKRSLYELVSTLREAMQIRERIKKWDSGATV